MDDEIKNEQEEERPEDKTEAVFSETEDTSETEPLNEAEEKEKPSAVYPEYPYKKGMETAAKEPVSKEEETKPEKEKKDLLRTATVILCCVLSIAVIICLFIVLSLFDEVDSLKDTVQALPQTETALQTEIVYRDENSVSDIVAEAMKSAVAVASTVTYQQYSFFGTYSYETQVGGSGIIIEKTDDTLYIATNNHVIEDTSGLTVEFCDGTSAEAKVNGASSEKDIAIIAVSLEDISPETLNEIKVAKLHTEDDLTVGSMVIAIGNALGYGQSATVGYISALDRNITTSDGETITGLIQTDAAINAGNSGGALLNMNGEVIGINVAKIASASVEGIGYSIPVSNVAEYIDFMSTPKAEEGKQGQLGIQCSNIDETSSQTYGMPAGVFVYKIINEDLLEDGLLEKDIITAVNGHKVSTSSALTEMLEYYEAGETVTLTVERLADGNYTEMDIDVVLIPKEGDSSQKNAAAVPEEKPEKEPEDKAPDTKKRNIRNYLSFPFF